MGAKTPTMRKTALAPSTASAGKRARAGSSQCSPGRRGPELLDREPHHPEEAVRVGAGGRDVHVEPAAPPEDDEREGHEHARDREGHPGAEAGQQLGDDEHRGERAQVDHPVVEVVDLLEQVLAPRVELVAHVGRRGGLDPAGADGDEREAEHEPGRRVPDGDGGVAEDVAQREPEDDPVAPQEAVGDPGAHERRQVHGEDEEVVVGLGVRFPDPQEGHHVDGEDRGHPVEREALAPLVPGQVPDLRREAVLGLSAHEEGTV